MENIVLRSGLTNENRKLDVDFIKRLETIVITMLCESTETAMKYCKHSGRKSVSDIDFFYGLKYQAREFLKSEDLEDNVNQTHDIMYGEDENDNDDDSDDSDESENETVEVDEPFTRSTCACEFCVLANEHVDTWEAWCPTDEAEMYIKSAVDKTVLQCQ